MAKRRTRKQKQKITRKRREVKTAQEGISQNTDQFVSKTAQTTPTHSKQGLTLPVTQPKKPTAEKSLLRVSAHFLANDMLRSLLITAILVASLIGIYIYLRYN